MFRAETGIALALILVGRICWAVGGQGTVVHCAERAPLIGWTWLAQRAVAVVAAEACCALRDVRGGARETERNLHRVRRVRAARGRRGGSRRRIRARWRRQLQRGIRAVAARRASRAGDRAEGAVLARGARVAARGSCSRAVSTRLAIDAHRRRARRVRGGVGARGAGRAGRRVTSARGGGVCARRAVCAGPISQQRV